MSDLATMSPYITERVKRFGEYPIDGLDTPPEAFDPHLQLPANRAARGWLSNGAGMTVCD